MITIALSVAVDAAIRATVLAAAVAAILALFRVRSSSTRHAVWTAALLVMLLTPALSRMVPSVSVPLPRRVSLPIAAQVEPPASSPAAVTPQAGSASSTVAIPSAPLPRASAAPAADWAVSVARAAFPWRAVVVWIYATGVVFFLVRLLAGLVQLSRIRRESRPLAPLAGAEIFESSAVATPVTVGVLSPRVVLPVSWREWPADMLAAVVAHERAHAARRDPLIAGLARLNCALYWFHPVAWWLERELALTAEHTCDDVGVTAVTRPRYAETLLEIAVAVRRHRGRLVLHGVGVHGDGHLARRIDRVLSTATWPALSRTRRALVAASCALVMAAAIACGPVMQVEPLREDPELAAQLASQLKARQEDAELRAAAERMTPDEAAALERSLEQNPEDMVTREKLLILYGTNKRAEDWKANAAARRPHALWLIQHHPENALVTRARVSRQEDPDGYAQARRLWMATIARPDVNATVLGHAASFFQASEKPVAERILLRAQAQQPDGPQPGVATGTSPDWASRLGDLYAYSIIGKRDDDPDVKWARERLEQSTDARVLYAAGYDLSWRPAQTAWRQFGQELLDRASRLDPAIAERVRAISNARNVLNPQGAFGGAPPADWPALLARSTGVEKLRQLTALAQQEYLGAEYYDWLSRQPESVRRSAVIRGPVTPEQDRKTAEDRFARSKAHAREAIDLASTLTGAGSAEAAFRAHITYGLLVFREGDRDAAIRHLREAASLPAPPQPPIGGWASELEYRLVYYLLKHGERQTIVEYFERAALGRDEARRDVMLKAAAAIRDGRMPEHYQRLLASGSV